MGEELEDTIDRIAIESVRKDANKYRSLRMNARLEADLSKAELEKMAALLRETTRNKKLVEGYIIPLERLVDSFDAKTRSTIRKLMNNIVLKIVNDTNSPLLWTDRLAFRNGAIMAINRVSKTFEETGNTVERAKRKMMEDERR